MKRLAIITTHPIQYNAPLFKLLNERGHLRIKVFYTWGEAVLQKKYDPGFGKTIAWDIPLLEGYEYSFVKNVSKAPGSHHFKGIINPTLNKEIEEWGANAILVYGWNFMSHLQCLRYFHKRIPVLFRGDSTLLNEQTLLRKVLRKQFLRFVYRHIDKVLYVGSANKAYYKEYGVKKQQLVFAPHAIDIDRFASDNIHLAKEAREWKEQLGIPGCSIIILFAGKLELVKNPGLLISAFGSLNLENFHLVIAGNGGLENELKLISKHNNHIHFIPFQNQSLMPALYRLADVFVLPSISETWGLAVNEAMACGKAVLVSNKCGCAQDLVQSGINGYVFESTNKEDLVKKMKQLNLEKAAFITMGNRSLQIIQDWSFQKICEAIEQSI